MTDENGAVRFEKWAAELVEVIEKYDRWLIYIKGSPDPDAIAASFVLKLLCESRGKEATIFSPLELSLPQNIKITKSLHLPIRFKQVEDAAKHYDAFAVLDHQSVMVEGLTGVIPCGIHIDHHEPATEEIPVDLRIRSQRVGSTSTLMIFLVQALDIAFSKARWRDAATVLYYGIQTDTDDFQHVSQWDKQAMALVYPYTDKELLEKVYTLPFTREALEFFRKALVNPFYYKDWMICGIGYIAKKHRDTLGIIGDFLVKRDDISVVVVFGIVEQGKQLVLDASFRSKSEDLNLNALIKKITRNGGARKYKGAYQVGLEYFTHCPDRELLWEAVYCTTVETLKKQRDIAMANGITRFFSNLKTKFSNFFGR